MDDLPQRFVIRESSHRIHNPFTSEKLATLGRALYLSPGTSVLHRTLNQAAPLRPLPDSVTDLDHFRVQRRDRVGGVIHEYRLVA